MSRSCTHRQRGQAIPLFALSLVGLLLAAGLVVDVGYAFAQQRTAQNAADFAALAGARVLGEYYTGQPTGAGTDANVAAAVGDALSANRAQLLSAQYVDPTGKSLGSVGNASIPSGAVGVVVNAKTAWHPFLVGIIGVTSWTAGADATAITQATPSAGVMPVGINESAFELIQSCSSSIGSCALEPGTIIQPGNFGWLKFGARGKCDGFGLGMSTTSGCGNSQTFLDGEIGPPANSYGCCTAVDTSTPNAYIGGLTGNEWGDLSYYVDNKIPVWVPIYDTTYVNGANAYYHIVGFAEMLFVGAGTQHAKWLTGVALSGIGPTPNAALLGATGKVTLVH